MCHFDKKFVNLSSVFDFISPQRFVFYAFLLLVAGQPALILILIYAFKFCEAES